MKLHYIQHVPFENPGSILIWAADHGHTVTATHVYADPHFPELEDLDWLIIMGGPMNIDEETRYPWLVAEKELIRAAVEKGKVVIGLCLGGQLIAGALGGKVTRSPLKEIGWLPVRMLETARQMPLFDFFPEHPVVFQWHGDTFSTLPEGAVLLATSPACPIPAELVTFYEDGAIDSVFPLNGQIGFAWSEEEEGELARIHEFPLVFGRIAVKLNGLRFYPDGKLKSLIFWPGEVVSLHTPGGDFFGRIGVRLHDDGSLESFEPAVPVVLNTPIGPVPAFDVNALAVDADFNSIRFDRDGKLVQLKTSGDIVVQSTSAGRKVISSRTRMGLMDDTVAKLPLTLSFAGNLVTIDDGVERFAYDTAECRFLILPDFDGSGFNCTGDCHGCSC